MCTCSTVPGGFIVNQQTGPPEANLFLNSSGKFVSGSDAATWCLGDALGWPKPPGEGHPRTQGCCLPISYKGLG